MLWIIIAILALCILSSAAVFYFLLRDEKLNEKIKNEFISKESSLNAEISSLKEQLTLSKDNLDKEQISKQAIEKELQEFKAKSEKLNKDLSLTSQMYEGLKAQYSELERLTQKPPEDSGNNPRPKIK